MNESTSRDDPAELVPLVTPTYISQANSVHYLELRLVL
jgi:hypothetical protein